MFCTPIRPEHVTKSSFASLLSVVVNQPLDTKAGGGEPAATPRGGNTNYSSCSTRRQQDAHNSTHDQR